VPNDSPPALQRRAGTLVHCLEARADCTEWEVVMAGERVRAIAFPSLCGPLRPGDPVLLNTTAVTLGLGTGGTHFVIARGSFEEGDAEPFPGRAAGHILKLRYTPLQHRVRAAEEEASPYREAVTTFGGLRGMPVLAAELHSQAAAAALAARDSGAQRIVWVQLDTAALPLAVSRLVARLRADGVLAATVTVGQGFGGDYEAVNVYSGLVVAAVSRADLILVTQGPGNTGTGTEYGFSGLALAEALHAAATLGGAPILAPRLSEGDPRARHRGLSHHTRTLLKCLHVPVAMPLPTGVAVELPSDVRVAPVIERVPEPSLAPLEPYRDMLTTMGRTLEQDRLFFRAAAAAGTYAAARAAALEEVRR
jgi:hypothetical protein